MLGNNNYIDVTGQVEDAVDTKISQMNLVTQDSLKDEIEAAITEIEIKPELFDDVYAKKEHTHTTFNHDISLNGKINGFVINSEKTGQSSLNSLLNVRGDLSCTGNNGGGTFHVVPTAWNFVELSMNTDKFITYNSQTKDLKLNGTTSVSGNLTVANINNSNANVQISGTQDDIKFYVLDNNKQAKKATILLGTEGAANKCANFRYFNTDNPYLSFGFYGNDNILKINSDKTVNIDGNLNVSGTRLEIGNHDIAATNTMMSLQVQGKNTLLLSAGETELVQGNLKITNGDLYVKGVKIDGTATVPSDLTVNSLTVQSAKISATQKNMAIDADNLNIFAPTTIGNSTSISGDLTVSGKINGNLTITHETDEITEPFEIGTFCETNGGIYTGYEKIDTTDCICQVQQSNTLNPKIVGVITASNQFASHGDVLIKIVPGTYHLGDILCPDITGKARKATETELQYMMLHAIPRAKITSLDTKIDGTVAAFLF